MGLKHAFIPFPESFHELFSEMITADALSDTFLSSSFADGIDSAHFDEVVILFILMPAVALIWVTF
jgi:hypothetical protein